MPAASSTYENGGDAHPTGLQLAELNQRSARLGVWLVASFQVREEEWTLLQIMVNLDSCKIICCMLPQIKCMHPCLSMLRMRAVSRRLHENVTVAMRRRATEFGPLGGECPCRFTLPSRIRKLAAVHTLLRPSEVLCLSHAAN